MSSIPFAQFDNRIFDKILGELRQALETLRNQEQRISALETEVRRLKGQLKN